MAKKEVKTDLWVYDLLKQAEITLDAQGSNIKEIDEALKTASKKGTGNVGFPEYVGVVKDYLLVIEDKASLSKHIKLDDKNCISVEVNAVRDYAVNGALFYAKHLAKNTTYKKILAFGVSGDERKHKISPLYVDETEFYRELPEVQSFISFNEDNIDEYYTREILKEDTDTEKETAEILKDAAVLHEDLRNYGNLLDTEKPLIVSGIMLALREAEFKNFSINDLTGDTIKTDGQKIYDAIDANLKRANVSPAVKKDKILGQFAFIKDTVKLNEIDEKLNKTPLKHFAEFLYGKIYRSIRYSKSAEDYIGRFYGEFMSYSGGDGQTLGIILTPKHITQLFCELLDLKPEDVVFEKTLSTLIQTNDTYESTQIDAFFESKPKIDAFLKIDANAQKVGIQNGILTPDVLETGCRFYVCGIFLVCFLYCVLRTSEKRAVSSFPLSCMPRLIHSSIHP